MTPPPPPPVFFKIAHHDGKEEDGGDVVAEGGVVEGVGRLQDDRRKEPMEEQVGAVVGEQGGLRIVHNGAEADAHQDQQAERVEGL